MVLFWNTLSELDSQSGSVNVCAFSVIDDSNTLVRGNMDSWNISYRAEGSIFVVVTVNGVCTELSMLMSYCVQSLIYFINKDCSEESNVI